MDTNELVKCPECKKMKAQSQNGITMKLGIATREYKCAGCGFVFLAPMPDNEIKERKKDE